MGKGEKLTKENVIETTRTWIMTREMVVSTLLGLLVVVGMRIIDNVWSVLGLIALVFINYYLLMGRKRKLSILDSGSLMYYTEDLDRQVIRLRHYDHVKIKGHLFNFGVLNIIYLELIGIVMNSEVDLIGENTVWVKALVTILVYVIAFNYTSKKHSELVDKELKKQIETNNKGVLITLTPSEKEEVASYYGLMVGNRNSSVEQDKQEEEPIKEPIKEPQEETLVEVIAEDMVEEVADELVEDLLKEEIKEEVATEKDIQEKLVPVLEQVAHKKETEMKNKDIVTVKPYDESESEIVSYDWDVKVEDTQDEDNQEVEDENNQVEEGNKQEEDIMVRPTEYTSKVIESKLLAYKEENKDENEEGIQEDTSNKEDATNEEDELEDFLEDIQVISDVKSMSITNGYYKK